MIIVNFFLNPELLLHSKNLFCEVSGNFIASSEQATLFSCYMQRRKKNAFKLFYQEQ